MAAQPASSDISGKLHSRSLTTSRTEHTARTFGQTISFSLDRAVSFHCDTNTTTFSTTYDTVNAPRAGFATMSTSAPSLQASGSPLFDKLPAELRNQIWGLVLCKGHVRIIPKGYLGSGRVVSQQR